MSEPPERPYHHGDLKRALMETAQAMLREAGGWRFTLRELARRAHVSHTAPYKHFADKSELLAEISMHGHRQLCDRINSATRRENKPPHAEIVAILRSHVGFALTNASLYRLMFSSELAALPANEPEPVRQSTRQALLQCVSRGQETGDFRRGSAEGQARAAWAFVHGLSLLLIDQDETEDRSGEAIDDAISSFLKGVLA